MQHHSGDIYTQRGYIIRTELQVGQALTLPPGVLPHIPDSCPPNLPYPVFDGQRGVLTHCEHGDVSHIPDVSNPDFVNYTSSPILRGYQKGNATAGAKNENICPSFAIGWVVASS